MATSDGADASVHGRDTIYLAPESGWAAWLFGQLGRLRVQFLGAVLLGIVLPVSLRWGGDPSGWLIPVQFNTAVACGLAILFGLVVLRQIGTLPGVREGFYVVPAMLASYAIVLMIMLFARIDYNRYLFPSSLVIVVLWVVGSMVLAQRYRVPRFGVVPGGTAEELLGVKGGQWLVLAGPALPTGRLSGVVADLRQELSPEWERFIADCAVSGVRVLHSKQLRESMTGRVEIEHLSENTLGALNPDAIYLKFKQMIDWVAALVAVVMLSPFLLLIAVLIRLDSPGPALFQQTRIGFRGKPFTVFKFRTMVESAGAGEDRREAAQTKTNDTRITSLGRLLRHSRLDELPQLFNILKGEMSWIGPRPEAEALAQWYEEELPFYRYRHIVRPGISGWAQVNQGHVTDVHQVHEKLHYDFYYIKNFSPWLDVLIVMRTLRAMLSGFGAR